MLTRILRAIGVISAAIILGFFLGVRYTSNAGSSPPSTIVNEDKEVERSKTRTDTVIKPDGTKTITVIEETEKKKTNKEQIKIVKQEKDKHRIGVSLRPEWDPEKGSLKGHPVITAGYRLYDTPWWAEVSCDIDRKEFTVGISVEW